MFGSESHISNALGVKNLDELYNMSDQIISLIDKENNSMKEKIDNNSRSLKWEQNGELAHKDLSALIERLKNVESEHTSSELSRLGTKSNIKD